MTLMTPKATREEVFLALNSEREYQDWRFDGLRHNRQSRSAIDRSLDEFILYIVQYAQEAAMLTTHGDEVGALNFVRKVGALTVGCMEAHGAPHRERPYPGEDGSRNYTFLGYPAPVPPVLAKTPTAHEMSKGEYDEPLAGIVGEPQ